MSNMVPDLHDVFESVYSIPGYLGLNPYTVNVLRYEPQIQSGQTDPYPRHLASWDLPQDSCQTPDIIPIRFESCYGYANPRVQHISARHYHLGAYPDTEIILGPLVPTSELMALISPQDPGVRIYWQLNGPNLDNVNFIINTFEYVNPLRVLLYLKRSSTNEGDC